MDVKHDRDYGHDNTDKSNHVKKMFKLHIQSSAHNTNHGLFQFDCHSVGASLACQGSSEGNSMFSVFEILQWRKAFLVSDKGMRWFYRTLLSPSRACRQTPGCGQWWCRGTQVITSLSVGEFLSHKSALYFRPLLRTFFHTYPALADPIPAGTKRQGKREYGR